VRDGLQYCQGIAKKCAEAEYMCYDCVRACRVTWLLCRLHLVLGVHLLSLCVSACLHCLLTARRVGMRLQCWLTEVTV
jgi:hypothetical protein